MKLRMETAAAIAVTTLVTAFAAAAFAVETHRVKLADIERGRYLIRIGACNDCHTPGYMAAGGKVDEREWLTGDAMGWRGPWGTTYPANLRLYVQSISEDAWVERTKNGEARPPMPWFNLHAMTEDDLRAIYRYTKAMGPAGKPAPAYVPPGEEPQTPYFSFEPQMPKTAHAAAKR
jgi:mono/diheme cytochrome c family protein